MLSSDPNVHQRHGARDASTHSGISRAEYARWLLQRQNHSKSAAVNQESERFRQQKESMRREVIERGQARVQQKRTERRAREAVEARQRSNQRGAQHKRAMSELLAQQRAANKAAWEEHGRMLTKTMSNREACKSSVQEALACRAAMAYEEHQEHKDHLRRLRQDKEATDEERRQRVAEVRAQTSALAVRRAKRLFYEQRRHRYDLGREQSATHRREQQRRHDDYLAEALRRREVVGDTSGRNGGMLRQAKAELQAARASLNARSQDQKRAMAAHKQAERARHLEQLRASRDAVLSSKFLDEEEAAAAAALAETDVHAAAAARHAAMATAAARSPGGSGGGGGGRSYRTPRSNRSGGTSSRSGGGGGLGGLRTAGSNSQEYVRV